MFIYIMLKFCYIPKKLCLCTQLGSTFSFRVKVMGMYVLSNQFQAGAAVYSTLTWKVCRVLLGQVMFPIHISTSHRVCSITRVNSIQWRVQIPRDLLCQATLPVYPPHCIICTTWQPTRSALMGPPCGNLTGRPLNWNGCWIFLVVATLLSPGPSTNIRNISAYVRQKVSIFFILIFLCNERMS